MFVPELCFFCLLHQKERLRDEAEAQKRHEEAEAQKRQEEAEAQKRQEAEAHKRREEAEAERLKVRLFRRHERTPPDTSSNNDPGLVKGTAYSFRRHERTPPDTSSNNNDPG